MKKNITKKLLERAAVNAAKVAAGTASFNTYHQPKEPQNLKKMLRK